MGGNDDCGCKVGRVAADYGLSNVDARLVDDWRAGTSVRQLTDQFNEDVVDAALADAGVRKLTWRHTPVLEALHTDELSDAEAIEIRRELELAGVDVERLADDLVSHQTVYRHLTGCLDAARDETTAPAERREDAEATVHALRQRTVAVTESTVESLWSAGVASIGEPEVFVDVRVVCRDCDRSMDFETAVREGCHCDAP